MLTSPPGPLSVSGEDEPSPALLPVYAQMPLRAVSGHGSWLVDDEGNEWLDAYGGHAVASTGHSHPRVVEAIAAQAGTLLFYSTAVPHYGREMLADRLAGLCPDPLGQVFLCNSGAEANENALHLARRHTDRQSVVTLTGGWKGARSPPSPAVTGRNTRQGRVGRGCRFPAERNSTISTGWRWRWTKASRRCCLSRCRVWRVRGRAPGNFCKVRGSYATIEASC